MRSSKLAKGLELVVLLPQRGAVVGLEDVEGRERLGPAPSLGLLDGHGAGRPVPRVAAPELGLRSEVNTELNFPPNFEGLVLGCIDADFCK